MSSNSTMFKLQIMKSSQLFHELWGNTYILLAYFLLYEEQQAMEKNMKQHIPNVWKWSTIFYN
jgi:hypothetical protein